MQNKKPKDRIKFLLSRWKKAAKYNRLKLVKKTTALSVIKKKPPPPVSNQKEIPVNRLEQRLLKRLTKNGIAEIKRPSLITDKLTALSQPQKKTGFMDSIGELY